MADLRRVYCTLQNPIHTTVMHDEPTLMQLTLEDRWTLTDQLAEAWAELDRVAVDRSYPFLRIQDAVESAVELDDEELVELLDRVRAATAAAREARPEADEATQAAE